MLKGFFKVPQPSNEITLNYTPGSAERVYLENALADEQNVTTEIPMYIGAQRLSTDVKKPIVAPHRHQQVLAYCNYGDGTHATLAIKAALDAKKTWEEMPWEHRASVFLKAAELISTKYRYRLNARTMLGQSKNAYQAEIDSACELIDFLRFNVHYMAEIYAQQPPISAGGVWNRTEQRPLEGFVFALTPFNFTAIAGNLPCACAMMGNVVVWKPADTQIFAADLIMQVLLEAGLPPGVINLIYADGPQVGDVVFKHPDFAGIHFTGSTNVFQEIWKTIGNHIHLYKSYPRIVGETGGKDFILLHPSADWQAASTALLRGAFEYQGQKCSAASRAYIPASLWAAIKNKLLNDLSTIKMGPPTDFSNFINAVIDEKSFDKVASYLSEVANDDEAEIIYGGNCDKSIGYFVEPTVILTQDPYYKTMCEEIFGPVLSIYVYDDEDFEDMLTVIDHTSIYALTGSVFAQDRLAIAQASEKLKNAAGNFYINDKCTGAVVGQQPFGGARKSGTNDKAGAMVNLLRWVSPRTVKETFDPPTDYRYPFLDSN
ncbi:1-pyrroline-5-carboxylate dehydrogenase [Pelobium manganitolerans]|uniref:L-glutamate gamma-semialdehyde dehydrogenase n=1 Tax=Pelobium manganitolerans TaxID=1842495 RepID=A0A419S9U6_9SPHI|nr:L-glutamate gamma-semialdehyde dehydrogenase [Pelobium manganitolerans]RKD18632.1 1-pyrroline-5-carboxylate dehydrogenase [Pelobium manganitolerans]